MRHVILEPINKAVVTIQETKEFRLYIMDTVASDGIHILKKVYSSSGSSYGWQWLSILSSGLHYGNRFTRFYDAMHFAVKQENVYELEGISELIEYLKDREEEFLDKV